MSGIAPSTNRHHPPRSGSRPVRSPAPEGVGRRADNAAGDAAVSTPRTAESLRRGKFPRLGGDSRPEVRTATTASEGGVAAPHDSIRSRRTRPERTRRPTRRRARARSRRGTPQSRRRDGHRRADCRLAGRERWLRQLYSHNDVDDVRRRLGTFRVRRLADERVRVTLDETVRHGDGVVRHVHLGGGRMATGENLVDHRADTYFEKVEKVKLQNPRVARRSRFGQRGAPRVWRHDADPTPYTVGSGG